MLRKFRRCRRLNEGPAQPAWKTNTFAIDICAGVFEQFECLGKLIEFDADFLEHGFGIVLDQLQGFFG